LSPRRLRALGALAAIVLAASCAELPEIEANLCGNDVVEVSRGEDCDGVAARARKQSDPNAPTTCTDPGSALQCRYACETSGDCPVGWGCDLDEGVCATGTGVFAAQAPIENGAVRMVSGDFDGDGRQDLVLGQPSGLDGNALASAYFFGPGMQIRERRALPIAVGAFQAVPSSLTASALAKKSDAGFDAAPAPLPISDLSFASSFGLGILRGSPDQPFVPELLPYQSLVLGPKQKASQIIVIPRPATKEGSLRGQVSYVVSAQVELGGKTGTLLVPFTIDQKPDVERQLGTIAGPAQDVRFIGAPTGEALCFRGDGCAQTLVWSRAQDAVELLVLDAPVQGAPRAIPRIPVPPGIDSVAVGDVDGDGIYDVVVGPKVPPNADEAAFCPFVIRGATLRAGAPVATRAERCNGKQPFVGLADLNNDGIADFVYGTSILLSSRAGDAGAPVDWRVAYVRVATAWTRMEVGDYDGDGKVDAILAVQGQSGLDVVRGGQGELRLLSVPTPEPVDTITSGYFDADRMIDIAYTTKLVRSTSEREASAYIVFGGPENETVSIGRKNVSQLVNLKRPLPDPFLPDTDFLGLVQDTEALGRGGPESQSVLYTTYVPQGRAAVSVLRRERGEGIAGRAQTFGSFNGQGTLDAVQVILRDPSQCGREAATVQTVDDVLTPPGAGAAGVVGGSNVAYGPELPIAVVAGRTANHDEAFLALVREGNLAITRAKKKNDGTFELEELTRLPYVPVKGACPVPNAREDALYPHEKLALVDIDDDGDLDLVFSDGGRLALDAKESVPPGLLVVLQNDKGTFTRVSTAGIGGRGFAKVRLGTKGSALAVISPAEVAFYRLEAGALTKLQAIPFTPAKPAARAIEAGDFDGDGVDDLAVLSAGTLEMYRGVARVASVDGGAE